MNEQGPTQTPRNPLRNEADMFRVLIMFGVGAAIVIAVALLIGSLAGRDRPARSSSRSACGGPGA